MPWRTPPPEGTDFIERIPEVLRLIIGATLLIDLIIFALFSLWIVWKICQQLYFVLERYLFVMGSM